MQIIKNKTRFVKLASLLVLAIFIGLYAGRDFSAQIQSEFLVEDFVTYWASGRLLLEGQNPYSPEQLFELQKSVGWTRDAPLLTYNPPWGMVFVLPFCLKNYATAKVLWLSFNLALMFACAISLWRFYKGPDNPLLIYFVVFAFAPTLMMLKKGQIVPLVLLGAITFLYFERRKQYWLAGAGVILMAVKPHVVYLFWPALSLWVLDRRQWSLLSGFGVGILTAVSVPIILNPNIFSQYYNLLLFESPLYNWATPSIGFYLRLLFGAENRWLQFLSVMGGALWLLWHWHNCRKRWQWDRYLPFLLLLSVTTTYYVWLNDYILLLPAIIQGFILFLERHKASALKWLNIAYLLANGLTWAIAIFVTQVECWFIWISLLVMAAYLPLQRKLVSEKQ